MMSHRSVSVSSPDVSPDLLNSDNLTATFAHRLHQMRPNLTLWPSPSPAGGDVMSPTSGSHLGVEAEVTQAAVNSDSPMDVAMTILTVFILSPLIICGNSLLLAAFHRYKRLRTPSNCLVASLAMADMGVGLFLPLGAYFELTKNNVDSAIVCLLPYCTIITICNVSILSMTAIALDRYTSLAQPLRYNNIITKTSVGRYVSMFWMYGLLLGSAPIMAFYYGDFPTAVLQEDQLSGILDATFTRQTFTCSFDLVGQHVRIFLFCMLYAPCAIILLFSYAYVYIVARYHAHAIYSVELSVRQNQDQRSNSLVNPLSHHTFHPRYGRTLAITVGFFLLLWTPFQVCMLMDAFSQTVILRKWTRIYLAFVAFTNSAFNPWVYGYRNAEFRLAYQKILEDFFTKLGVTKKQDLHQANGDLGIHSCASNVRLCVSPNHLTMTTLLKPTYVQAQETTSCANGDSHVNTVVVCETVITSDVQ